MIPQSMTQKILARNAGKAFVRPGDFLEVNIDMAFTHDPVLESLMAMFYEEFGSDAQVWDPKRIALFEDHFVPAKDSCTRALALAMARFAREQGIQHYYPYGGNYGVCHVVMCEEGFVLPGTVVVGTDSHSVTYGAFNAFGTGVGLWDMVSAFRIGSLWFRVPEVVEVRIDGSLRPDVMAKDVILRIIGDMGMGGASGKTLEFTGTTIDNMPAEDRMTICNMVVEAGAKNGIMKLNAHSLAYLKQVARQAFEPVTTDPGFEYHHHLVYRAEEIGPLIAYPDAPNNVHTIDEAKTSKIMIDQVYVGSCTGGKFSDIQIVADLLKGRRVADGVQLVIVPASMRVHRRMASSGVMRDLVEAGGMVESPGCKACYGAIGPILGDGEVCLSTTNRNFRGRMGNPKSKVYLSSPYVAAKSALAGFITD